MTDTIDRAQLAALGARPPCPRCGTPGGPTGHGYTSAGYTCPPHDPADIARQDERAVCASIADEVAAEWAPWQRDQATEIARRIRARGVR